MSQSRSLPQEESLNKALGISFFAHVLIVMIFTLRALFFSGDPIAYESAIRVDIIGLPDKVQPDPASVAPPAADEKALPQKSEPAPEIVEKKEPKSKIDPEAINLEKTQKKQKDALAKLKQLNALESLQKDLEKEKAKKGAAQSKQLKGNQISSGSQLRGLTRLEAEQFIGEVERKIRSNWALPQWLAQKQLSAQVRVRFDENGNILSAQVVKSSGNSSFDEIAIDTVRKSAPLPPPPEQFVRLMNVEGILLGFPD